MLIRVMWKKYMNKVISILLLLLLPTLGFAAVSSVQCQIIFGVDDPLIGGVGAADLPDGSLVQVIWTSNTNTQELNYADADYLNADEVLLGTFTTTSLGAPPLPGSTIFDDTYDSTDYGLSETNFLSGSVFMRVFNGTAATNSTRFANSALFDGLVDKNAVTQPPPPLLVQTALPDALLLEFVNTDVPEPLPAPTPLAPTGNTVDATPQFFWTSVAGADFYTLTVTMEGVAVITEDVLTTTFQVLDRMPCGDYEWTISATEGSIRGAVSSTANFTITDCSIPGPVTITRPIQNHRWRHEVLRVKFDPDPLAFEYRIVIRKNGAVWNTRTTTTTLEDFGDFTYGTYTVEVRAIGVNGSTLSAVHTVTYGVQYGLSTSVFGNNQIYWRDITQNTSTLYQIQIFKTNGALFYSRYVTPAQAFFQNNRKFHEITRNMVSGEKYDFRARARQNPPPTGITVWSEWGATRRFTKQ